MKDKPLMFKFAEGEAVALTEDHPSLGLRAGDVGVVWVMYTTTPPAYDVTFSDADGEKFDIVLEEDELTVPSAIRELTSVGQNH